MNMESKEFEYNGKLYRIEKYTDGEIKVFEHRLGEQKELIVNKLGEYIQAAQGAGFDSRVIEYVEGYIAGTNKDDSQTTRSLGKVLFDHLP
jgi:uncharacterized protein (UPF0335 family)